MSKVRLLLGVVLIITLLALSLSLLGCKELTVSVSEPRDGVTITAPTVEVRGIVSDAKATVWVIDSIVAVSSKGYYSTEVTLTEGENAIKVTAARGKEGKWKNVVSKTVTVTYSPK